MDGKVGTEASVTPPVAHTSLPPPHNQWPTDSKHQNMVSRIKVLESHCPLKGKTENDDADKDDEDDGGDDRG